MTVKQLPGIKAPDGSDYATLTDGNGNLISTTSGSLNTVISIGGTDVIVSSASANSPFGLFMSAVAGATNYVTGFEISYTGATVGSVITATLNNVLGGQQFHIFTVPTGVNLSDKYIVEYTRPLPAIGQNTQVFLSIPALGAGNVLTAATLHGFYQ